MKPSFSLVVLPFLLGVAVFGFFKSLDLVRRNSTLEFSADGLNMELARAQDVIKESKKRLNTAECRNEILLDDLTALEKKLAAREQEVRGQLKNIAFLVKKFQETTSAYAELALNTKKRSDEYMALAFENAELKARMKSLAGLKRQMRKARRQGKMARSQKLLVPGAQTNTRLSTFAEAISLAVDGGNAGFIVKEGELTYAKQVEISVQPQVEELTK